MAEQFEKELARRFSVAVGKVPGVSVHFFPDVEFVSRNILSTNAVVRNVFEVRVQPVNYPVEGQAHDDAREGSGATREIAQALKRRIHEEMNDPDLAALAKAHEYHVPRGSRPFVDVYLQPTDERGISHSVLVVPRHLGMASAMKPHLTDLLKRGVVRFEPGSKYYKPAFLRSRTPASRDLVSFQDLLGKGHRADAGRTRRYSAGIRRTFRPELPRKR